MKIFSKPCVTIDERDALNIMAYAHWAKNIVKYKKFKKVDLELSLEATAWIKSVAKELHVDFDSVVATILKLQLKLLEKKSPTQKKKRHSR